MNSFEDRLSKCALLSFRSLQKVHEKDQDFRDNTLIETTCNHYTEREKQLNYCIHDTYISIFRCETREPYPEYPGQKYQCKIVPF